VEQCLAVSIVARTSMSAVSRVSKPTGQRHSNTLDLATVRRFGNRRYGKFGNRRYGADCTRLPLILAFANKKKNRCAGAH
jgi:hypothetical protein